MLSPIVQRDPIPSAVCFTPQSRVTPVITCTKGRWAVYSRLTSFQRPLTVRAKAGGLHDNEKIQHPDDKMWV